MDHTSFISTLDHSASEWTNGAHTQTVRPPPTVGPIEPWVREVARRNVRIEYLQSLLRGSPDADIAESADIEITRLCGEVVQLHTLCIARDATILTMQVVLAVSEEEASARRQLEQSYFEIFFGLIVEPCRMGHFEATWEAECRGIRQECAKEMSQWRRCLRAFVDTHTEMVRSLTEDVKRIRGRCLRQGYQHCLQMLSKTSSSQGSQKAVCKSSQSGIGESLSDISAVI